MNLLRQLPIWGILIAIIVVVAQFAFYAWAILTIADAVKG